MIVNDNDDTASFSLPLSILFTEKKSENDISFTFKNSQKSEVK